MKIVQCPLFILERGHTMCIIYISGDHDAVSVLLMVPRVTNKADLLASQVKEKVSWC